LKTSKRFLYVNRRAPHGTIYAHEGLETVLMATAFEQKVSLVFLDDGVYQLKDDQDTRGIGTKNFSRAFRALEDHGIDSIYVEKESLEQRGLTAGDLSVPVEVLTSVDLRAIMSSQDVVISL